MVDTDCDIIPTSKLSHAPWSIISNHHHSSIVKPSFKHQLTITYALVHPHLSINQESIKPLLIAVYHPLSLVVTHHCCWRLKQLVNPPLVASFFPRVSLRAGIAMANSAGAAHFLPRQSGVHEGREMSMGQESLKTPWYVSTDLYINV